MVMPLGPDYAKALGIEVHLIGWIAGAYTFAAGIGGLISSLFLDRFDRKKALLFCFGMVLFLTAATGFAWNFHSLVVTRFITGLFSGTCTALCMAIVSDFIVPQHRGKAIGKVMAAFGIASVLGVPFGLEIASHFGWRAPFFVVPVFALPVWLMTFHIFPPITAHLEQSRQESTSAVFKHLLHNRTHWIMFFAAGAGVIAGFMLIPHVATYVLHNLGFERKYLGLLYMAGGVSAFICMRITGYLVDKMSITSVTFGSCLFAVAVYYGGFIATPLILGPTMIYILFMGSMSMRNICVNTLATRIPPPQQRAGFMALVSSVTHFSAAGGGFISSMILQESADGMLIGIPFLATIGALLTVSVPVFMWWVEYHLRLRENAPPQLPPII